MSSTATTTLNAGGVRQSTRQTRTNPSRTSKAAGRSSAAQNTYQAILGGSNSATAAAEQSQTSNTPHGFYPAITHFTDAILALPREVRRHTSLLKEVDAKAWALEENLQTLLHTASGSQPMKTGSQLVSGASDGSSVTSRDQQGQPTESQDTTARRRLFYDLRYTLSEMMFTSDEKNHVLVNANDELQRQLGRLDAVYPYVEGEVSDEARLGSTTHWAYSSDDPKNKKKNNGPSGNERPRREVASANQNIAQDDVPSRSETRRQAVNTRKNKRTHADLDFEDGRPATTTTAARKTASGAKNQRSTDTPDRSANSAANTAAATPAPAKRRKVEKQAQTQAGATAENNANNAGNPAEAKDTSAPDAGPKKRTRAPPNPAGRKRTNTVTSNTGPPSAISSPVIGTFNAPRNAASPAPSTSNRPQSSRTQNTTSQNGRQRPQSTTSSRGNNNAQKSAPSELHKSTLKEAANIPPKREETPSLAPNNPTTNTAPAPAPISTVERQTSVPKGRSKTSTPVTSTFSESSQQLPQASQPQRSRSTRATEAPAAKRSHKKGANQTLAAQQQAAIPAANSSAALALEDDESSRLEDEDEDDESEPRYCYCNQVSFGEMVACDNDTCPREWFHLSCVGLSKPPLKSAKWYCNECKDTQRRGNRGNGR